jgi:hypothetical protein
VTREALATLAWLAAGVGWGLRPPPLPPPRPPAAAAASFAAGRAVERLRVIALAPRPVASERHGEVRRYLLGELAALGIPARVEEATGSTSFPSAAGYAVWAGRVQNVVGRLRGRASTGTLLLVTHYDSVPTSPGAGDAGACAAALLEVMRAVRAGGPLRNDLEVLLSDGEETGLLGAEAFAASHGLEERSTVVLNFDARGAAGPVLMFETGPDSGWLLPHFAATPFPAGSSLAASVYRYMPNGTDFTVFRRRRLAGLNFAFIHRPTTYHNASDSLARLDLGTLQQLGDDALALTRRLGGLDLAQRVPGDAVYFDLGGFHLAVYAAGWSLPLAGLAALGCAALGWLGRRRRRLTRSGMARGAATFAAALAAVPLVSLAAVWAVVRLDPGFRWLILGPTYRDGLHFAGLALFAVAVVAALYARLRPRCRLEDAAMGALAVLALLALATAWLAPSGSYLVTWPLLGGELAMAALLGARRCDPPTAGAFAAAALGSLPALLLLVPWIALLYVGLTVFLAWAVALFVALLAGLLVPQLYWLTSGRRWLPAAGAAAGALVCLAWAAAAPGFDREHPRPDSLFYALDADSGAARWASLDARPDDWTAQGLGRRPRRAPLAGFAANPARRYLQAAAPALPLAAPSVEILEVREQRDERGDRSDRADRGRAAPGRREIRLRASSPRGGAVLRLDFGPGVARLLEMDGQPPPAPPPGASPRRLERLLFFAPPPGGFELRLLAEASAPLSVNAVDFSLELPRLGLQPRPAGLIPQAAMFSETTLVRKSFHFSTVIRSAIPRGGMPPSRRQGAAG